MTRLFYTLLFILLVNTGRSQSVTVPELVADICTSPAFCSGFPYTMGTFQGKLLFAANQDSVGVNNCFYTYTRSSGVSAPYLYPNLIYQVYAYAVIKDTVYFLGHATENGVNRMGMMKWDGINRPQFVSTNIFAVITDDYIQTLDDKIYYRGKDTNNIHDVLWRYDPATGVEEKIWEHGEFLMNIAAINGRIYLNTVSGASGYNLYTYDPKTNVTHLLFENMSSVASLWRYGFSSVGNDVYFMNSDIATGTQLYRHDGKNPPVAVTHLPVNTIHGITLYTVSDKDGNVYFPVQDENYRYDLWQYSSTTGKSRRVTYLDSNRRTIIQRPIYYNNKIIYDVYYSDTFFSRAVCVYDIDLDSAYRMPMPFDYSTYFASYHGYVYDGALFLSGETDSIGVELFKYEDQQQAFTEATLYPNPATNEAHIRINTGTSQVFTLTVLDMLGHTVSHKRLGIYPRGNHEVDIPIQHLASGVYICTLRGSKNILFRGKLVKL